MAKNVGHYCPTYGLNTKPYPIKENTFEMWNSYIDKDITTATKDLLRENIGWFYYRKNNNRMENETLYIALIYLQFYNTNPQQNTKYPLEYYKVGNKILFRIRSKEEITKSLEDPNNKQSFVDSCNHIKQRFIAKARIIASEDEPSNDTTLNKNLDYIFNVSGSGKRTQQNFYALWHFLSKIEIDIIPSQKLKIRKELSHLFKAMNNVKSIESYEELVENFWNEFKSS